MGKTPFGTYLTKVKKDISDAFHTYKVFTTKVRIFTQINIIKKIRKFGHFVN